MARRMWPLPMVLVLHYVPSRQNRLFVYQWNEILNGWLPTSFERDHSCVYNTIVRAHYVVVKSSAGMDTTTYSSVVPVYIESIDVLYLPPSSSLPPPPLSWHMQLHGVTGKNM